MKVVFCLCAIIQLQPIDANIIPPRVAANAPDVNLVLIQTVNLKVKCVQSNAVVEIGHVVVHLEGSEQGQSLNMIQYDMVSCVVGQGALNVCKCVRCPRTVLPPAR